MNADQTQAQLMHGEVTERVLGVFYEVYNELGQGFLESVYHNAMLIALAGAGLSAQSEVATPVWFRNHKVGDFRADIIVDDVVLLELKSAESIEPSHEAQTLNYLRATQIEVALLLNFGPNPQFRRLVYGNDRKKIRVYQRSSAAGAS